LATFPTLLLQYLTHEAEIVRCGQENREYQGTNSRRSYC
jgi:hypothetical protein